MSQAEFADALLDAARPPPSGLVAWNGSDPALRLAVHRNNVMVSLVGALAETFPVVTQLVGDEFFAAMARCFVTAHPPASPVLAEYGEDFAAWLETFAPAASLPCLPDLARLERARVRACHAADRPALPAAQMARRLREPEALPAARLQLQPSLSVLASRFALVSLWAAHQGAGDLGAVDLAQAEAALVLRDGDDVLVIGIDAAQCRFIAALADGQPLDAAVAAAASAPGAPALDLAATLSLLIRHGAIVAWQPSGEPA